VRPPTTDLPLAAAATIDHVELHRVRLALVAPFVAAHGTEHEREVVLVHAVGVDGGSGWGECVALAAPTYTHETTATAWRALHDELVPAVLAGQPVDAAANPMAWTAVESALADLALRRDGRPLVDALGGRARPLDTCAVVGLQADVDATVAAVARRVGEGYAAVKLKVEPGHDRAHLEAVRAAHPDIVLAADANGAYGRDHRDHLVATAAAVALDYVEQPLAADDLEGSAALARALAGAAGTAVALDEAIGSAADLERALAAGAGSVINVKPGRVGGLAASAAMLERLRAEGLGAFVGGMLESGIGRAIALAVASLDGCTRPTDLGPSARYVERDVTAPIAPVGGARLQVPAGPGIGIAPDPDALDALAVARAELRR
jgi:O-succinylbenzoate synthase